MAKLEPNPGILDIAPYKGGLSRLAGVDKVIKLSSNESALGPGDQALAAYRDFGTQIHRYPDGGCTELREALSEHHKLDVERIVCGAGSDEIFAMLAKAYAGPGDEVIYSEHGFLMFPICARAVGATPVRVNEKDLTADVDAILKHVNERTRIVFIANPNNPTGSYLNKDALEKLHKGLPDRCLLVLDGAYAEFVTAKDYTAGAELVEGADNVIMTRTFSKIYALGGLRLGFGYCPPAVADVLNRVRMPFNVSAVAQTVGLAALADQEHVKQAQEHNERWRAWLTETLRGMGVNVPESQGNFVLARFKDQKTAENADAYLKEKGIIARRVAAYGLPDSLRITVGLEHEIKAAADALKQFMDKT